MYNWALKFFIILLSRQCHSYSYWNYQKSWEVNYQSTIHWSLILDHGTEWAVAVIVMVELMTNIFFMPQVRGGGSCHGGTPGGSCLDSNLQHLLLLNSLLPASSPPSPTSQYSLFTSWGCPKHDNMQAIDHLCSTKVCVHQTQWCAVSLVLGLGSPWFPLTLGVPFVIDLLHGSSV